MSAASGFALLKSVEVKDASEGTFANSSMQEQNSIPWLKTLKTKAVGGKSQSQVQGTMEPRTTCRYSSSKVLGTLEASYRF